MLRFGIEIEFILKPENTVSLLSLLDQYKDILISNKEFKPSTPLFIDGSVSSSIDTSDPSSLFHLGFEIKTRKLEYTKENFDRFKSLFEELSKIVYSNTTCGIHVHCSKKRFSLKDHFALLYEYLDKEYYKEFLLLEEKKMSDETYANVNRTKSYFHKRVNKAIKNNTKIEIDILGHERKVDLYKVHLDYNSIEFRGLRGHFSKVSNTGILSTIESYLSIMETLRYEKQIKEVFVWEEQ